MGISREVWDLRDGTPPNKGKTPPNKGKTPPNKGKTPPNKEKPFQTRKTFPNKEKPFQARKNTTKQEKTPPNKKTAFQARKIPSKTRETPFEQGNRLSSKGYLPIKCKSLQVVGVPRQGKVVVSDGRYGVIGG